MSHRAIVDMMGWSVIEYANPVREGKVSYSSMDGDGTLNIGWVEEDGGNRTTTFNPENWQILPGEGMLHLIRVHTDDDDVDLPPPSAKVYLVQK